MLRVLLPRIRALFTRRRDESRLRREIREHLELSAAEHVRHGLSPDAAREAARRDFGGIEQMKERHRDERGLALIDTLAQDVRHAARTLRRAPGFTTVAVLTLALGIGATTAIFSVVHSVLIKPLPYTESDALVRIVHAIGGRDQTYFSDVIFLTYMENTQTLADIGVWSPASTATVTGQGDPEEVRTLTASHGVLTTLGVRPDLGRIFSAADDTPGAPNVVILSSAYWQRTFGGDRGILGRVLSINGRPHQVIGVIPAGFRFDGEHDLVLPLRINRGRPIPFFRLVGVARLKPGVTLAQANADAARILRIWLDDSGQTDPAFQARYAPALRPLKQDVVGEVGRTLWVLMGTIGLVLLMACANVANLLLVRANARGHEFAIRAALGSRRSRIARLLLVESLTLALLGCALGLAIAYTGLRVLVAVGPSNLPRLSEISIDSVVLIFALAASLFSGLLFGLIPIVKCAGPRLAASIGDTGRGATLTGERQRSQNSLVTVQIALALVLLVSAGLMIRSFQALLRVDPGFAQPQHVQTFSITIPPAVEPDVERLRRMQQEILDRLATIPGVASAAFTTRLPMDPSDRWSAALTPEGKPDDGRTPPNRQVKVISPGMFQTLGTPLVAGRDFTWTDLHDVRDIAIISENLAREFWGSADAALGKRIRQYYSEQDPWREIVGVAADVHDDGAHQQPPATIYWPGRLPARFFGGYQPHRVSVALRTERAGSESLVTQMHEAVWAINPRLPLADVRTLESVYDQSLAQTSFTLVVLAIAGAMALLLGMCGIYGVIAYAVSQRRREIGIRLALGAQMGQIRALFVRRGMILAGIGVAVGLGGAIGFTRLMRSLLFGISPLDPITFAAVPAVLIVATVLASYLPARRAMAIDPVETMRAE